MVRVASVSSKSAAAFCAYLRQQGYSTRHRSVNPMVSQFLRDSLERRLMVLKRVVAKGVSIEPYETFSTIAILPRVRAAILEVYEQDPDSVIGDLESLRSNVPIVYMYEPLKNKWGNNRRGRPRKVQISGVDA